MGVIFTLSVRRMFLAHRLEMLANRKWLNRHGFL